MSKDRTEYWREYARKNADKRKAVKAAYRARNKEKIAAYARTYRAEHAGEPRKPRVSKPRPTKPRDAQAKAEAFISLKERFAAFRAAKHGAA